MEGLIESIALLTIFCLKVLVLVVVAGITLTAIIVVVTFIRVVVKEVVLCCIIRKIRRGKWTR